MGEIQSTHIKAIVQQKAGGPETLEVGQTEIHKPAEDEVMIKVEYTALNRADTLQRQGLYPPPAGASKIIGLECAGYLINSMDEVTSGQYKNNKKVMALISGGGYAQYTTVHKDHVMDIPSNLTLEQAAAIPEVWITAFQLLVFIANVQKDEVVLIHAAASGVGTSLIQLCKKYQAKCIAVSSNEQKLKYCQELGADYVINYKENPDYSKLVMEYTNNKGANIILDPVAAQNFQYNLASLALDSRWVIYGALGGSEVDHVNLRALMGKRANLHFTTLRNRTNDYKTQLIQRFSKECLQDFQEGRLKPIIDKVYKLSEVAQAHEQMEKNENIGKIILQNDLE